MATNPSTEMALGIHVTGPIQPGYEDILSRAALGFVAAAEARFVSADVSRAVIFASYRFLKSSKAALRIAMKSFRVLWTSSRSSTSSSMSRTP